MPRTTGTRTRRYSEIKSPRAETAMLVVAVVAGVLDVVYRLGRVRLARDIAARTANGGSGR